MSFAARMAGLSSQPASETDVDTYGALTGGHLATAWGWGADAQSKWSRGLRQSSDGPPKRALFSTMTAQLLALGVDGTEDQVDLVAAAYYAGARYRHAHGEIAEAA